MGWGDTEGFGNNPVDKLIDKIAGIKGAKNRVKSKVDSVKPSTIKAKAVQAVKNKVTGGVCSCRGVKRGQVCPGCGSKLM